eukprot:3025295-Pleurochrysis_carterae.AAC.1
MDVPSPTVDACVPCVPGASVSSCPVKSGCLCSSRGVPRLLALVLPVFTISFSLHPPAGVPRRWLQLLSPL